MTKTYLCQDSVCIHITVLFNVFGKIAQQLSWF